MVWPFSEQQCHWGWHVPGHLQGLGCSCSGSIALLRPPNITGTSVCPYAPVSRQATGLPDSVSLNGAAAQGGTYWAVSSVAPGVSELQPGAVLSSGALDGVSIQGPQKPKPGHMQQLRPAWQDTESCPGRVCPAHARTLGTLSPLQQGLSLP